MLHHYFFSETGTKRKLLSIVYQIRKESIDIDKIYLGDNLCISYYNKDQNIILNRNYDSTKYVLLSGDNEVPKFDISEYVMKYGNIFYLRIMGGIRTYILLKKNIQNMYLDVRKYILIEK